MKKRTLLLLLIFCFTIGIAAGCGEKKEAQEPETKVTGETNKKAILVVSFGTSYQDTLKACIESVENKIKDTFKDYEIRRAFTSEIIIKKLAKRDNLAIDNPQQALERLKEEGFTEVVVQPLHIIPGHEYEELCKTVDKYKDSFKKIVIGRPLLYYKGGEGLPDDYTIAVNALKNQLPELSQDKAVVLVGHGTTHFANACYSSLQSVLDDNNLNVLVGTIEGYPEIDDIKRKLKERNIKEVVLMPYMLVAGDHARNDIAGDEEDSWKMQLKKEGYVVDAYLHGLGENPAYQEIYVQHVRDAIAEVK